MTEDVLPARPRWEVPVIATAISGIGLLFLISAFKNRDAVGVVFAGGLLTTLAAMPGLLRLSPSHLLIFRAHPRRGIAITAGLVTSQFAWALLYAGGGGGGGVPGLPQAWNHYAVVEWAKSKGDHTLNSEYVRHLLAQVDATEAPRWNFSNVGALAAVVAALAGLSFMWLRKPPLDDHSLRPDIAAR